MSQSFVIQVKDDIKRRMVIDKKAWELEGLEKDDYVKVTIEKLPAPAKTKKK